MAVLAISVAALLLGPLLYRAVQRAPGSLGALDGFVMVAIGGLVLVHIIPHGIAAAGPWALALAVLGFLGPGLVEKSLHRAAGHAHTATIVLATVGLMVHAFFDGVALAAPEAGNVHGVPVLATAIVIHRLPVAITVWWLLRRRLAVATLALLASSTVLGFAFAGTLSHGVAHATWVGLVQAIVGGSLLHVVIHRPAPLAELAHPSRTHAGLGALAGIAVVVLLADTHLPLQQQPGSIAFGHAFLTLCLESAPALLLAFALAGLVQVVLPHTSLKWLKAKTRAGEAVRGMAFGLPLPICSCGVIPVYRSLILRGVPAAAAIAFLVATPELGIDAVLISLPLLGTQLTLLRIATAALVALIVGVIIGRIARLREHPTGDDTSLPAAASGSVVGRARAGLRYGFVDIVDHIGPWLVLGIAVAALLEPMMRSDWLAALPWGLDVIMFAVIGMPSYVCASAATPLVAVLIHKGVSGGAAIAFLLTGPATNVTTFGILSRLHGRKTAIAFGATMAVLCVGVGFVINAVWPDTGGISLHEAAEHGPSAIAVASLAILAGVMSLSILRQGPRGFVAQILRPYSGDTDHHHDHGHDHGHEADAASAGAT